MIGYALLICITVVAIVGVALLVMSPNAIKSIIDARNERVADEQEHRQRLERERLRHAQRLAEAEKLREVLQITIADRAMGDVLREEVERIHPQVRVEPEEESEEKKHALRALGLSRREQKRRR